MQTESLHQAIFLDRDGTINEERNYLIEPKDFVFIPGAVKALQRLQQAGYLLVVVSNQSGVARGYFTEDQVNQLHADMQVRLESQGVQLAGIYFCPHHPLAGQGDYLQDCSCRKGQPGLLLRGAQELSIDLSSSYMIGDKVADVQAGLAAGCQALLVRTGYGESQKGEAATLGAHIVADLSEAAEFILSSSRREGAN